ncbi:hypothetical protein DY000_02029713 [Brassica cretica]|uniref:Agenet domain-containing protein n=1 Tax=Brassica cretica TaxID=69181 RepID=A0ABQ7DEG9_BRACR|nr:hypothetical protein DY000_02029713 [Brassica cretica]
MLRLQLAMTLRVESDKIRPKPPADDREKKFEMMDNVESFYSKSWSSGQVRMILGENTFSVYLNSSMETLEFKASDLRIHREWLDGVWKMADENEEPRVQTHFDVGANVEIASKDEDKYVKWYPGIVLKTDIRNGVELLKGKPVVGMKRKVTAQPVDHEKKGKPVVGMKRKATAQPVDHAKNGKPVVGMKRKATAQPVDRLAFLQREEKRPIVPRNPPMSVTPEVILPIEPFVTPEFPLVSRLGYWMQLCGIHYVKNLKEKHVDAAFAMLNQKRIEQSSWFSEQVLIPAIKLEMMNEEINFNDIVPFQVKKAEGLPKTKLPFNCGLFVVKMLECRSLGLKKMSSINDDTAMDLRSKLCCEMFDQFMDKDF